MKYWRGYLTAAVFAAITWGLMQLGTQFTTLVDMIYPYITRMVVSAFADWTGGLSFCLWQVFLVGLVAAGIVTLTLMIVLRWNFFQWMGWVLASASLLVCLHTGIYGLNSYAGPLSDDIRLTETDYTVKTAGFGCPNLGDSLGTGLLTGAHPTDHGLINGKIKFLVSIRFSIKCLGLLAVFINFLGVKAFKIHIFHS